MSKIDFYSLDVAWLKQFYLLSKVKNYARAAQQLYLTQQALSRNMIQLEKHLGMALIHHRRGGAPRFALTPFGCEFAVRVAAYLAQLDNLPALVRGEREQSIEIGYWRACHYDGLIALSQQLRQTWPDARLSIFASSERSELEAKLYQGEILLALSTQPPQHPELSWTCSPESPWVEAAGPAPRAPAFRLVERRWKYQDMRYRSIDDAHPFDENKAKVYFNSCWPGFSLCEQGLGILRVPAYRIAKRIKSGRVRILDRLPNTQQECLIWKASQAHHPCVKLAREVFDEHWSAHFAQPVCPA